MGIKQLYNDNLRKLPNEYGEVSVMIIHGQESREWTAIKCKAIKRSLV